MMDKIKAKLRSVLSWFFFPLVVACMATGFYLTGPGLSGLVGFFGGLFVAGGVAQLFQEILS